MTPGDRVSDCVRCGYCCKQVPCSFGMADKDTGWCVYLVEEGRAGDVPTYSCSDYREIVKSFFAEFTPAFGAGCSSTLFNTDREAVIRSRSTVVNGDDGDGNG